MSLSQGDLWGDWKWVRRMARRMQGDIEIHDGMMAQFSFTFWHCKSSFLSRCENICSAICIKPGVLVIRSMFGIQMNNMYNIAYCHCLHLAEWVTSAHDDLAGGQLHEFLDEFIVSPYIVILSVNYGLFGTIDPGRVL